MKCDFYFSLEIMLFSRGAFRVIGKISVSSFQRYQACLKRKWSRIFWSLALVFTKFVFVQLFCYKHFLIGHNLDKIQLFNGFWKLETSCFQNSISFISSINRPSSITICVYSTRVLQILFGKAFPSLVSKNLVELHIALNSTLYKNLWDELECRLWARPYHPTSVLDVTNALVVELEQILAARINIWFNIPLPTQFKVYKKCSAMINISINMVFPHIK